MKHIITKGRLTAGLLVIALAAWGMLPFLVFKASYGEVPIPGSATVHLPAGEVDVSLRASGPAADAPLPPLSFDISGPGGTTQPDVIESPRWKYADTQDTMLIRVWVVRIAQEADYHVEVGGEVYRPYQQHLAFGRPVWNEALETLAILGALMWVLPVSLAFVLFVVIGPLALVYKIRGLCAKHSIPARRLPFVRHSTPLG